MKIIPNKLPIALTLVVLALLQVSCGRKDGPSTASVADPELSSRGAVEVLARLVEIPDGAIFKRDLYDYATILKYEVIEVKRGELEANTIYVGHYNPWKSREEAADKRVQDIGGKLKRFEAGQVHHMALDAPIDDSFMGGIVNKYFGQTTGPLYWAVWTNPE